MPRFWESHLDDICVIIGNHEVENTRNSLNRLYSNDEFTLEIEKGGQLPFLDRGGDSSTKDLQETDEFKQVINCPSDRTCQYKVAFLFHNVLRRYGGLVLDGSCGWHDSSTTTPSHIAGGSIALVFNQIPLSLKRMFRENGLVVVFLKSFSDQLSVQSTK